MPPVTSRRLLDLGDLAEIIEVWIAGLGKRHHGVRDDQIFGQLCQHSRDLRRQLRDAARDAELDEADQLEIQLRAKRTKGRAA